MKRWILVLGLSILSTHAFAKATTYTDGTGGKIILTESAKAGSSTFYVKLEGVNSAWAGKVIKVRRTKDYANAAEAYVIDYEKKKGLNRKKEYGLILADGSTMRNGNMVGAVAVYLPEKKCEKSVFVFDEAMSKEASGVDLEKEYEKTPFIPDL